MQRRALREFPRQSFFRVFDATVGKRCGWESRTRALENPSTIGRKVKPWEKTFKKNRRRKESSVETKCASETAIAPKSHTRRSLVGDRGAEWTATEEATKWVTVDPTLIRVRPNGAGNLRGMTCERAERRFRWPRKICGVKKIFLQVSDTSECVSELHSCEESIEFF